jgi:2-iminobutanoate/2-iminopropanoate deaminase
VFHAGDWSCISGQLGITPDGLAEGFAAQAQQLFVNLGLLLETHGLSSQQIAKTTVFLADMSDYAELNEAYTGFFGDHRPARSAVAVAGLPFGALVEIEAWVYTGT